MLEEYPDSLAFIESIESKGINAKADYLQTQAFLKSYSRKSDQTFTSFRNEVERILLWAWTVCDKSLDQLKRSDIESYFDFLEKPPAAWISKGVYARFIQKNSLNVTNSKWRPFSVRATKAEAKKASESGKEISVKASSHSFSQSAWNRIFSTLSVYFDYLAGEDYVLGNPIPKIKRNMPQIVKNSESKVEQHRLTDLQWEYILESTLELANQKTEHERTLFLVACLKSLYLRISELSPRPKYDPDWGNFFKDHEGNWWLTVIGKGNKERDISVPSSLLSYIKRYRLSRGLEPLPSPSENKPIISSMRSGKAVTSRQLRRIVQQAFDNAYRCMIEDGHQVGATTLRYATTHWLRHTGASQDIDSRPIKHMADDLGHATMGTTDKVYINSDRMARAASGKDRTV